MYGMARDGRLPRVLAYVHPDRKVPQRAILFIAALNLVTALIFANSFELLTTLVCFGALVGFLMLHLSVLVHFRRQQSSRWGRHVVVPAFGGAIVAYVLWNMALDAQLVGVAWLAIGLGSWLLVGRLRA
jgi:amino acid transporter